ncbi:lantibiotic ABC transporter ATP-binding protein [Clostridium carboxidivorans P7]|uniref:ABC transporter related protein n=1 Tax=Clostridium carboxidivorans P7 TaxID=536227 RepID=C6PRR8_9CLOT|nr:lantibiotic protection ABC transporter ATP-binding protein [Clostridium carboxidivorans]AKN31015.1 lantibiotic ABC transporter ATP-binding protein [Clostridium carboxidivorans P7]EET88111.1 ABC transporter related protein [Clostridium carboxidivorans P7]EFG88725.1 mutacin ABC transporter, ATP-binding protein MutF [Clostridium carboxidivorans P7]
MQENYLLQTEKLTKKFKKEYSVNSLSISIPKNHIYGLLGANGAGKSTTLKMITGLLKPTSGEIISDGHKWNRNDLKDIGSLIEQPPIYGNLTAKENLKVHTTLLGLPDKRIREVLKIVDLTDTSDKQAKNFSMGMKQRLGIAIAILNHPKLLILDEPTNGLDPIGIQDLRKLIKSFPEQGITVILSSHILAEVEQVIDYVGIMSHGILGYQGKINPGEDLEALFMDVEYETRKKRGII